MRINTFKKLVVWVVVATFSCSNVDWAGALYETLLAMDIKDSELEQLFKTPWTVLPAIEQITGALNSLH